MSLLAVLCSATNEQADHNDSKSGVHDALNTTVVLNRASEHYLGMIFQDYSDNLTGRISVARFKDLLQDLNLGEVAVTSPGQAAVENSEHRNRQSRSYSGFAGPYRRQNRRSVDDLKEPKLHGSYGNPAMSRDRKPRDIDEHSHHEHEQVSVHVFLESVILRGRFHGEFQPG